MPPVSTSVALAVYVVLFVYCAWSLFSTLSEHPLFPFQFSNLEWTAAWLKMTVVDYYGAALPLCGIVIASESPLAGLLWSLAFCIGGSPFCCAYVISRLTAYRDHGLQGLSLHMTWRGGGSY